MADVGHRVHQFATHQVQRGLAVEQDVVERVGQDLADPHHGGQGYVTPFDCIGYKAANKAYSESFGVPAIPVRSGGSIPIVALFEKELKSKTILMGFGLDSDAIHSPNEHFGIFNYLKGIETIPLFYKYFTEMSL